MTADHVTLEANGKVYTLNFGQAFFAALDERWGPDVSKWRAQQSMGEAPAVLRAALRTHHGDIEDAEFDALFESVDYFALTQLITEGVNDAVRRRGYAL